MAPAKIENIYRDLCSIHTLETFLNGKANSTSLVRNRLSSLGAFAYLLAALDHLTDEDSGRITESFTWRKLHAATSIRVVWEKPQKSPYRGEREGNLSLHIGPPRLSFSEFQLLHHLNPGRQTGHVPARARIDVLY